MMNLVARVNYVYILYKYLAKVQFLQFKEIPSVFVPLLFTYLYGIRL